MQPLLPQNDPSRNQRIQAIEEQRQNYEWSYYPNRTGIPMVKELPDREQPFDKPEWIRDAVSLILRVFGNQSLEDFLAGSSYGKFILYGFTTWIYRFINNLKNQWFLLWLLKRAKFLLQRLYRREEVKAPSQNTPSLRKSIQNQNLQQTVIEESFEPYQNLFQIIYLPCISKNFQEDRVFAAHRVAGPNPLVIERVKEGLPDNFPVTDEQYQAVMGQQDSLSQAIQDKRLYLADYKIFDGIKPGNFPPEYTKHLCAPLALFAVPQADGNCSRSLVPVAIQCHQVPSPKNPIYTPPPLGTPKSDRWFWLIAKTIVQIADANYHELISHLGRTHLLIEPFIIATARELAPNHPLGILLRPHFQGTLFINNAATVGLINQEGIVDATFGGTLEESLRITVEGVRGYPFSFNDSMLPKFFEQRGLDNVKTLPDYPYRDDGMLIWNAIHQWVDSYISVYYHSDRDVVEDTELQNWFATLVADDGGRMTGFGESNSSGGFDIHSKTYLVDAVTLIIFTCSAQHAAVNFAQATYMSYAPNMPLAGYQPALEKATDASKKYYFDLLPPLEQAEAQMNITYTLGSVYYTQLGQYQNPNKPNSNYFTDENVHPLLETFQNRLQEIETIIQDRNAVRPTSYSFLLPSKIPQSINI